MKKLIMILMAVALAVLPTIAQNYGKPYKPSPNKENVQPIANVPQTTTFQSTSAMPESGSTYSANPVMGEDGTASYEGAAKAPGHLGKVRRDGIGAVDPETYEEKYLDTPIGDAVLPLVLLACAYFIIRATRRRVAKGM